MDSASVVLLVGVLLLVMFLLRWLLERPPAIGFFVVGLIGLSFWATLLTTVHSVAPPPNWAPSILIGLLLVSPASFATGAHLSLREEGPGAKVIRWANVVGLGVSAGLLFILLTSFLQFVVLAD